MPRPIVNGIWTVLLLLASTAAGAQSAQYTVPAASVAERFSTIHEALDDAADLALSALNGQPPAPVPGPATEATAPFVPDNALLRQFAQQYWGGQEENVRRALDRVARVRRVIDPILRQEGVPTAVAALVLVESGGRATALSPKGALGLWQLMPDTARRYGLTVTARQDDRVEIDKATRAAAHYLRDLYAEFGDWQLAFAAYNSGEQTVRRALAKNGARASSLILRSVSLPAETRNYVPAAIAALRLMGNTSLGDSRRGATGRNAGVVYAAMGE